MTEHGPPRPDHLTELRARVADGDVSWLRARHRDGGLDWLHDHLTGPQRAELGNRLEGGDVVWVRRVLGDVRERPAAGATQGPWSGPATGAAVLPEPTGERRSRSLFLTGVAVTAVALVALLLSQCRSGTDDAAPVGTATGATTTAATGATATTLGTGGSATTASATPGAGTSSAAPTTTGPAASTTTLAGTSVAGVAPAGATTTVAPSSTTVAPTQNLVDAATTAGLTTFGRAIVAAQLTDTLKAPGPYTVLAPSDAAFAKLPPGTLDALLKDRAALTRALRYHVLFGRLTSATLAPGDTKTAEGSTVKVGVASGRITVNDATVTRADVGATNGIIDVIDTVLLPPGFTVGGVVVTVPPAPQADLVQVLGRDGRFAVLLQALDAAGLTATLQGAGPYTLFAPSDAAFRALPPELLARLLADKATLSRLLTYHVLAGRVTAAALTGGDRATVEGDTVKFGVNATGITVDGAGVLTADVAAGNGVIHAIDKVLVPADVDLAKLGVPLTPPTPLTLSVYFDPDSAVMRPDGLAAVADAAKKIPAGARVTLVGVADQRGDATANQLLSAQRATAVQRAFEATGLKATFAISAKGAEPGTDLQQARRVDVSAV